MYIHTVADIVKYRLRGCWVNPSNLRESCREQVDPFTLHALVLEWVEVAETHRRQGYFKRFLDQLLHQVAYDHDLMIVEGVQNSILADALTRWGWEYDPGVMDFYCWRKK